MKKTLFILACCCSLFLGCSSKENFAGSWETTLLSKDGVVQSLCVSGMEIKPEGNLWSVSGNSGVNRFMGSFAASKGKITPDDKFASTRMMGTPEAQEFEDLFLKAFTFADSYTLKDNILRIENSKDNLILEFKKTK